MEGIRYTLCSRSTLPPVSVDPSEGLLWRSMSPSGGSSLLGVTYNTLIHYRLLRVVSNCFHLHTEKHWAISTIAGYQMAIANTLRATSGAEVGRNPALKSLLRNIEMERASSTSFSRVESRLSFVSIDTTTFRTARPNIGSAAYMEDSFPYRAYFRQTSGRNPCI